MRHLARSREYVAERRKEIVDVEARDGRLRVGGGLLELGAPAAVVEAVGPHRLHLLKADRGVLELLVLDELPDEVKAGVDPLAVVPLFGDAPRNGKEHPALYQHQRRGHHDELAGDVEVEAARIVDEAHVLLGDVADGDVVYVELFAADQVQEEVKGTLEHVEVHLVVVRE